MPKIVYVRLTPHSVRSFVKGLGEDAEDCYRPLLELLGGQELELRGKLEMRGNKKGRVPFFVPAQNGIPMKKIRIAACAAIRDTDGQWQKPCRCVLEKLGL